MINESPIHTSIKRLNISHNDLATEAVAVQLAKLLATAPSLELCDIRFQPSIRVEIAYAVASEDGTVAEDAKGSIRVLDKVS